MSVTRARGNAEDEQDEVLAQGSELALTKAIIEYLNKPPFSKALSLVNFDAYDGPALLQLLNDVLAEISPDHKMNLREEDPEQTIVRILGLLRVLKYKPTNQTSGGNFRQHLVRGSKEAIYPLLYWALKRLGELQKRAYLARFLQKIEVPPEIAQDDEVHTAFTTYENQLENFKELHKQVEGLRASGVTAADVKKDIASMEEEREQLKKRLERLRKKMETLPGHEKMLAAAHSLREESEREEAIATSRVEQRNQMLQAEQRLQKLSQELRDARANSFTGGIEGLIARIEEDVKMNTYLTAEKLPQAIREKEKHLGELQRVADEPALQAQDINLLHRRIQDVTAECNAMRERQMSRQDGGDDKLALFRQQSNLIARKKEATSERLQDVIAELEQLQSQQPARKGPSTDDLQKLVTKLRIKSNDYKAKKQEIGELQAEHLVLARTEEILRARDDAARARMSDLEARQGVAGFSSAQDTLEKVSSLKSTLDERKGRTLEDISQMVAQLTRKIDAKKSELSPIIRELRAVRTQAQEIETEYDEKKNLYVSTAAGLDSARARLDQDVKGLTDEVAAEETRWHAMQIQLRVLQTQADRAQREMQAYVGANAQQRRSHREALNKKVQEQEAVGKTLRDRQKAIKDTHQPGLRQLDIWRNLDRLLACKLRGAGAEPAAAAGSGGGAAEADRLVL